MPFPMSYNWIWNLKIPPIFHRKFLTMAFSQIYMPKAKSCFIPLVCSICKHHTRDLAYSSLILSHKFTLYLSNALHWENGRPLHFSSFYKSIIAELQSIKTHKAQGGSNPRRKAMQKKLILQNRFSSCCRASTGPLWKCLAWPHLGVKAFKPKCTF